MKERKTTSKKTSTKKLTQYKERDKAIIEEYFANGFNGVKAALKISPEISYHTAANLSNRILQDPKNKGYIAQKQEQLQQDTVITPEQIAQELKGLSMVNIVDYIGKTEAEIKELPPQVQRGLKRVVTKEKQTTFKGETTIEKTTTYETHDKIASLKMLGQYIGFFNADNTRKPIQINLDKADNVTLNNILNLIGNQEHQ